MTSPPSGRADLLLVEPDPAEAELAVRCFRSRVAVARDASEAMHSLETLAPRLVLVNPRLPGQDGINLVERMRADPRFRATPIVVLSSDETPADVSRALRSGANSVVVKPIRFEALKAALGEIEAYWLGRHASG